MELCIALDLPTGEANLQLARSLKHYDLWLKVGFRTFIRDGHGFIDALKSINPAFKIFLDLKLYDIPNTMADAAQAIADLDIDMFNVHASSGKPAMQAVMECLASRQKRPLVLAVTALTSFDDAGFRAIYGENIEVKAEQFAVESFQAGLDGVVCSVWESSLIKQATDRGFLTLTPGIRPFGESSGDQRRVADISAAAENMVDIAVVGRPVYQSDDPLAQVEKILERMKNAQRPSA